jgi:hypothetical protein
MLQESQGVTVQLAEGGGHHDPLWRMLIPR